MKALFLDDMKQRHARFQEQRGNDFITTHVYNYHDGISEISTIDFDILFLDHDLSTEAIMCDPDEDINELTGTDFVKEVIEIYNVLMVRKYKPGVIVHSLNPAGRKRMVELLTEAGFDAKAFPFIALCPSF